jgi:hypothetical protein
MFLHHEPLNCNQSLKINIMSNEIVKSSLTEIMSIGKAFAESGMFPDIKTAAQAVVKIQAGSEMGIPPFAAMSGIHIIQGKPTVGAGLMAANVKGSGKYDYRVIESSEKICSIDFYQGKEKIGNSTFTIDDAKKAGTKNIDKFPKNMLFARAISNGVKWFTPDIFSGPVYVPEEMEVLTENVPHEVVLPALKSKGFDEAIERIKTGELELIQKLKDSFTLTQDQLAELKPFEATIIAEKPTS